MVGDDAQHLGMGLARDAAAATASVELGAGQRPDGEVRPVRQDDVERLHVIRGAAVAARALARGIGGDHAADRGARRGRDRRREEQAVRPQEGVELVQHDAGLDHHAPRLDVERQDAVHVPRQVDARHPSSATGRWCRCRRRAARERARARHAPARTAALMSAPVRGCSTATGMTW